jgi:hypothetical protein
LQASKHPDSIRYGFKKDCIMQVVMTQHPVGQGGLFSGTLDVGVNKLRWIYDCGSNHADPLKREIDDVALSGPIDLLFLSHLDSDHVNGIDSLILSVEVEEVVLPYLNELDRSLLICRDLEDGRINTQFLDFARNPVKWLSSRGVKRITFVHGDDGGGDGETGGDLPEAPTDPHIDGKRRLGRKWSRQALKEYQVGDTQVREFDTRATVYVLADGHLLDWTLSPFAHRPPDASLKEFRKALDAVFGKHTSVRKITEQARTQAGRRDLKECYDTIWSDHNLVSMALYSGPAFNKNSWKSIFRHYGTNGFEQGKEIGWLCSGDANLRAARRRKALLRHYKRLLPRIDTLVLPHHGAASSFHGELLSGLPALRTGLAASGPNSYGHPHLAVKMAVQAHPAQPYFHKVSRKRSSQFSISGQT